MTSPRWFLVASVALAVGCSNSFPKESLDKARESVEASLTAWQQGEKLAALATRAEPIQFTEELWSSGHQLLSFQIKQTVGEQKEGVIRCFVALSLKDRKGRRSEREVAYQVTLKSPILIARDPYY